MKVLSLKNCDTCRKALKALDADGVEMGRFSQLFGGGWENAE